MKAAIIKTKLLSEKQSQQINVLWNAEYPLKLKDRFSILLSGVENFNHYIIEDEAKNVIAWAVDFEKENEIRFSIIVDAAHKHKGLGGALLANLKQGNKEFYGWVIDHDNDIKSNALFYKTPILFYIKHGFEVLKDQRIESDLLSAVKIKWLG